MGEVWKMRGMGYFGDLIWWLRYLLKSLVKLLGLLLGNILTSLLNWLLMRGLLLGVQEVLKSRRLNSCNRHDEDLENSSLDQGLMVFVREMKGSADSWGKSWFHSGGKVPLSISSVSRECIDEMVQDREKVRKYEIDAGKAPGAFRTLARWLGTASREAIQKPRDMRFFFGTMVVILSSVRRAEPTSPIPGNMERRSICSPSF
jgi:hypothetical protein